MENINVPESSCQRYHYAVDHFLNKINNKTDIRRLYFFKSTEIIHSQKSKFTLTNVHIFYPICILHKNIYSSDINKISQTTNTIDNIFLMQYVLLVNLAPSLRIFSGRFVVPQVPADEAIKTVNAFFSTPEVCLPVHFSSTFIFMKTYFSFLLTWQAVPIQSV